MNLQQIHLVMKKKMSKGFLKSAMNEEEPDIEEKGDQLEEKYMRLFPKIGRDFIHRDDFERVISIILAKIDLDNELNIDLYSVSEATKRALEYKRIIESGTFSPRQYQDLIELDDE